MLLSNYIEAIKGSAGGADDVTELEDDEEDDEDEVVNEPEEKRSKTSWPNFAITDLCIFLSLASLEQNKCDLTQPMRISLF